MKKTKKVHRAVVYGRVPVALWPRRCVWPDVAAARAALAQLLGNDISLIRLPEEVRRLRQQDRKNEAHPGRHLTLLFDDPNRSCPADVPATDPSRS